MEIEVGEFVRISYMYTNQKIAKIKSVLDKDPCYKNMQIYRIDDFVRHDTTSFLSDKVYEEDIIKHSKNLIDLIEVGDYVNGKEVRAVYLEGYRHYIKLEDQKEVFTRTYNKDIKSIVTKEQFKSIKYEVKL